MQAVTLWHEKVDLGNLEHSYNMSRKSIANRYESLVITAYGVLRNNYLKHPESSCPESEKLTSFSLMQIQKKKGREGEGMRGVLLCDV